MLKTSLKTRCREFELPRSNQNSAKLFSFAGILNSIKDIKLGSRIFDGRICFFCRQSDCFFQFSFELCKTVSQERFSAALIVDATIQIGVYNRKTCCI